MPIAYFINVKFEKCEFSIIELKHCIVKTIYNQICRTNDRTKITLSTVRIPIIEKKWLLALNCCTEYNLLSSK